MVKKMETLFNILFYCIYKFDYKLHMLSNRFNPFLLLGKIPAIKRKFEEQGTTHLDVVNKIWTDKQFGFGIKISGGGLIIIVFFIIFSICLISNAILNNPLNFSWRQQLPLCMIIAFIICYYMVFQNDKYIRYFKRYEKWSKPEKWKNALLSFILVIGTLALFIYSFRFLIDMQ